MQGYKAAHFPTIEELREQAVQENKRIRMLQMISAMLIVLCLVAGVYLGRQRAINSELAANRVAAQNEETDMIAKTLEQYTNEAFLYKVYTDNGDDYRAAHQKELMQAARTELAEYDGEIDTAAYADEVAEVLGIE